MSTFDHKNDQIRGFVTVLSGLYLRLEKVAEQLTKEFQKIV
jgi:hypothetical protein